MRQQTYSVLHSSSPQRNNPEHLKGLDGMRGIACLIIALFHLYFLGIPLPFSKNLQLLYTYGWLFVEFFMVVSGFILSWSYTQQIEKQRNNMNFGEFFWRRIARIYPTYFISLLFCGVLTILFRSFGTEGMDHLLYTNQVSRFLLSLFCVDYVGLENGYSFNYPGWFIGYLLLAYILYYFITSRAKGLARLTAYLGAIFLGLVCIRVYSLFPQYYLPIFNLDFGRILISFFSGCLTCWFFKKLRSHPSRCWQNAHTGLQWGIFLFTCSILLPDLAAKNESTTGNIRIVVSLLLFPLLLLYVLNTKPLVRFLDLPLFQHLGKISYSILLWQFPLILMIRYLNIHSLLPFDLSTPWLFVIYLLPLSVISIASHRFIELPGMKIVMKLKDTDWR